MIPALSRTCRFLPSQSPSPVIIAHPRTSLLIDSFVRDQWRRSKFILRGRIFFLMAAAIVLSSIASFKFYCTQGRGRREGFTGKGRRFGPKGRKRGWGSWGGGSEPPLRQLGVWGGAVSSSSGGAPDNFKFGTT